MNRFIYRLMYRFGQTNWDSDKIPPEVVEVFHSEDLPTGPALDLGCGTGTNVIYMARQGRQAIGVDFVPSAIAKARRKAQQANVSNRTHFYVGDVTRLNELDLPPCSFALDMGCYHGLKPGDRRRYVDELSGLLQPGGRYLLYALKPHKDMGITFGLSPEQVQSEFSRGFEISRIESGSFWNAESTWFWMVRKAL